MRGFLKVAVSKRPLLTSSERHNTNTLLGPCKTQPRIRNRKGIRDNGQWIDKGMDSG